MATREDETDAAEKGIATDKAGEKNDIDRGLGDTLLEPKTDTPEHIYPDGGWRAWLVVTAAFFTFFFTVGLQYCSGTYIRFFYYNQTFGSASFTVISFISSVNNSGFPIAGPIVGSLAESKGPRFTVILGGIIAGASYIIASFSPGIWFSILFQGFFFSVGEVMVYMAGVRIVSMYFNRVRGLALGVALGGSGIGGLVMAVVTQRLLDTAGWQWALRVEGIVVVATALLASLLFTSIQPPNPRRVSLLASARSYFRDSRFVILWISNAIAFFGYFIPFSYLPSYATQVGIDASRASLVLGITNGGSAAGRIALGYFADKFGYLNMYVLCQIITPVAMLFWPITTSFPGLIAFGLAYGFSAGGWISSQPTMLASAFGGDNITGRLGVIMSATLAGALGGSPLAGAILDSRTTYDETGKAVIDFVPMILFGGITMLVGNLMLVWVWGQSTRWRLKKV
ncbi:MFS general substrate transporter [Gonapodya prolifera JEL478]|uniref:MFS general substrate transporter n=1 Tax=Gonapodya prolifera (strain JEL478) TaxID=1344416 RepID=A0A139AR01_GONPJ|nr:MFS general substrate transporter [Gonapodya prolifera JEL478]|eukprot:KXS18943.1 MFS general substrate transporter [Gonapodya prolifera JEL478]